jgi:hypothetical protein
MGGGVTTPWQAQSPQTAWPEQAPLKTPEQIQEEMRQRIIQQQLGQIPSQGFF